MITDYDTVLAQLNIRSLKARHLRALDYKDWETFAALLTEDFVLDLTEAAPLPVLNGRETAVKTIMAAMGEVVSVHHAHEPEFAFKSADEVIVVWAMQDRVARGAEQPSTCGYGHHHDRWIKINGEWKLAAQKLTRLHVDTLPPAVARSNTQSLSKENITMNNSESITDWLALSQAKARYCRLLDSKDWNGFINLMTEDFELDVSEGSQVPIIRGREAAVKQIRSSIETAKTAHQVHGPEIIFNGDEAKVVWAMQDRVLWGPEKPSITGYGHYHERWVKRGGEWKIAALKLTRLHLDIIPPA